MKGEAFTWAPHRIIKEEEGMGNKFTIGGKGKGEAVGLRGEEGPSQVLLLPKSRQTTIHVKS